MLSRPLFIAALLAAMPLCASRAAEPAADAAYVAGIEDLPLMPGFSQAAAPPVDFDQPDGRIVESSAAGGAAPAKVLEFYAATLPQLGWASAGKAEYTRDAERLSIAAVRHGEVTTVRFTLQPR